MGTTCVDRRAYVLTACLLLAGCATTERRGIAHPPPIDAPNASYTLTCDGVVPGGFRASLVDGAAQVPADAGQPPYYHYYDVKLQAQASGDVDRDGVPDTVVLLQCSPVPSNGFLQEVQVISGAGGRLGELPSPSTLPEALGFVPAPLYDPAGLSVDDGDVVAEMMVYGPEDSHASGPSERATVRWHWDGGRFVRDP